MQPITLRRSSFIVVLVALFAISPFAVFAATQAADMVWGQPDFTSNAQNNGGVSASSLRFPSDTAFDSVGNLYLADTGNHRVLRYPLVNGTLSTAADMVWGQPTFTSAVNNNGGLSASSLSSPYSVGLDSADNLFVADYQNNRVLRYLATTGIPSTTADMVWGQPDFTSNAQNTGGVSDSSLASPYSIAFDSANNLFVSDTNNSRILRYPTTGGVAATAADMVWGQPSFSSNLGNNGGVSASSLNYPYGVAFDSADNLFISDRENHRALRYPTTGGVPATAADMVWGQPDFTSNAQNNGGVSASSLNYPADINVASMENMYISDRYNHRILGFAAPAVAPTISTQPAMQTVLYGTSASLTVAPSGTAPLTYQWYQGMSGDTTTPLDTTNPFTTTALTATTSYWVRVTNAGGSVDSDTARIVVSPVVATYIDSADTFGLENLTTDTLTVTLSSASPAISVTLTPRTQYFFEREKYFTIEADGDTVQDITPGTAAVVAPSCDNLTATIWAGRPESSRYVPNNVWTFAGTGDGDVIVGTPSFDTINGNLGNDTLCGGDSIDMINGGDGNDTIFGEGAQDTLMGGAGTDTIDGGFSNDTLYGGADDDTLVGSFGFDQLRGEDGNDTLNGIDDNASDLMVGGAGNDTMVVDGMDTPLGGTGMDMVDGSASTSVLNLDLGSRGIERAIGSTGDDVFVNSRTPDGAAGVTVYGRGGSDRIYGSSGPDTLVGEGGNDIVSGYAGNDMVRGGSGTDTLRGGDGSDSLIGEAGTDSLQGENDADTLYPDADDTVIRGGTGYDTVNGIYSTGGLNLNLGVNGVERAYGTIGNDTFSSTALPDGDTKVTIYGRAGDDLLTGSSGADVLWGEVGNDTIFGRNGDDTLQGGVGTDSFSGGSGTDRILDYTVSQGDTKDATFP